MTTQSIYVRVMNVPSVYEISRATLYRWAEKKLVKIHKQGNCAFVRRDEMDKAIMGETQE